MVVWYLHNNDIQEEFLHFTPAVGLDADSLLTMIKLMLSKCDIKTLFLHFTLQHMHWPVL